MMMKVAVPGQFQFRIVPTVSTLFWKKTVRDVHYIGGSEVLPAPLEPTAEARAIEALTRESADEAKSLLIEHNLRLVVYIAKKFDNTGVGVEDLISIGTIGLIKAVDSFDVKRASRLGTYAAKCIDNAILLRGQQSERRQIE